MSYLKAGSCYNDECTAMKKVLTGTAARAQAVQPYSRTIMAAVMTVLPADNQENALLALRIMECLHKVKRNRKPEPGTDDPGKLDDFVPPYLEFVQKVLSTCPPRRLFAGWLQGCSLVQSVRKSLFAGGNLAAP